MDRRDNLHAFWGTEQLLKVPQGGFRERCRRQDHLDAPLRCAAAQHAYECGKQLEGRPETVTPADHKVSLVDEHTMEAPLSGGLPEAITQLPDREFRRSEDDRLRPIANSPKDRSTLCARQATMER
jgi:hypothetical protein